MAKRANGEGSIHKRVIKRANGKTYETWQASITIGFDENGKQKRKTLYGRTQAEVVEKIRVLKQHVAAGTYSEKDLTLRQYLKEWLTHKQREVKLQTVDDYEYQLEKYVIPKIGSVKLSKLKPMHIQMFVSEIAEAISPQRANKCRRILSTALNQAVRWELIHRNPCLTVKPLKVTIREMKIWSPEEVAVFLDTACTHRLYALFYLALSTGMRRGELLGLQWDDISKNSLTVKRNLIEQRGKVLLSTPKTDESYRRISLPSDVMKVLKDHKVRQESEQKQLGEAWTKSNYVFVSQVGTCISPRNLERTWHLLQEKAREQWIDRLKDLLDSTDANREKIEQEIKALETGHKLPKIRLHDLRHLHASVLIVKHKLSAREVADRLGHTNPSFTMDVYTHLFSERDQRNSVSLLDYLPETSSLLN